MGLCLASGVALAFGAQADTFTITATASTFATNPTSTIVALGGAQAGVISISGAAAFTAVTVTPSVAAADFLSHSSGSPAVPDIEWNSITVYDGDDVTTTATNVVGTSTNTISVTTDGSGNADIIVGGIFEAAESAAVEFH